MSAESPFRPIRQPARAIFDALVAEQAHRKGRSFEEWQRAEREAVWRAARDFAQQNGICVPTIEQVHKREVLALGHTDYAAKWAYAVADLLVLPATVGA